jgi:hypothetical protein
METNLRSPRILDVTWGKLEVEGSDFPYKDAKLYPGGSREWNWRETGTEHNPGIQSADVLELLEHSAEVIILSTGVLGRLQVQDETLRMLDERKVAVHILKTKDAVRLYNDLCEDEAVGALIHSTC